MKRKQEVTKKWLNGRIMRISRMEHIINEDFLKNNGHEKETYSFNQK